MFISINDAFPDFCVEKLKSENMSTCNHIQKNIFAREKQSSGKCIRWHNFVHKDWNGLSFDGHQMHNFYGLCETCNVASFNAKWSKTRQVRFPTLIESSLEGLSNLTLTLAYFIDANIFQTVNHLVAKIELYITYNSQTMEFGAFNFHIKKSLLGNLFQPYISKRTTLSPFKIAHNLEKYM